MMLRMIPTDALLTSGWEDGALTVMARMRFDDGAYLTQASFGTITCRIYDRDNGNTLGASPAVVVASSVFDTLQTADVKWTLDAIGYNFKFKVPATAFPLGDRRYLVQFWFTPLAGVGDGFGLRAHHRTTELLGQ